MNDLHESGLLTKEEQKAAMSYVDLYIASNTSTIAQQRAAAARDYIVGCINDSTPKAQTTGARARAINVTTSTTISDIASSAFTAPAHGNASSDCSRGGTGVAMPTQDTNQVAKDKGIQHFSKTIDKNILQKPDAICEYGRKHLAEKNRSQGPTIEGVHSHKKNALQLGKNEQLPHLALAEVQHAVAVDSLAIMETRMKTFAESISVSKKGGKRKRKNQAKGGGDGDDDGDDDNDDDEPVSRFAKRGGRHPERHALVKGNHQRQANHSNNKTGYDQAVLEAAAFSLASCVNDNANTLINDNKALAKRIADGVVNAEICLSLGDGSFLDLPSLVPSDDRGQTVTLPTVCAARASLDQLRSIDAFSNLATLVETLVMVEALIPRHCLDHAMVYMKLLADPLNVPSVPTDVGEDLLTRGVVSHEVHGDLSVRLPSCVFKNTTTQSNAVVVSMRFSAFPRDDSRDATTPRIQSRLIGFSMPTRSQAGSLDTDFVEERSLTRHVASLANNCLLSLIVLTSPSSTSGPGLSFNSTDPREVTRQLLSTQSSDDGKMEDPRVVCARSVVTSSTSKRTMGTAEGQNKKSRGEKPKGSGATIISASMMDKENDKVDGKEGENGIDQQQMLGDNTEESAATATASSFAAAAASAVPLIDRHMEWMSAGGSWVQCDTCDKWRKWYGNKEDLPSDDAPWDCTLNYLDPTKSTCEASAEQ